MILKGLRLENIRSYLNEEIRFPENSVLLAGDIGSGKSSILLAIEFALFGIKSDLPGESLLRHGKNKGSVELKFKIGKNIILIKRNLKRMKDSVRQDSGYILINDRKIEGTATELKSKVISLLGYPESLVSKSKDLIFRFTVYTPQEEMKQILYESRDIRLETLRKVFGIDKYKRIRENIQTYTKELRTKNKEYESAISDLEDKQKQKKERENKIKDLDENLKKLKPELEKINESLEKQKSVLEKYEKDIRELNKLENNLNVYDNNILNISEHKEKLSKEIEELNDTINKTKKELDATEDKNLKKNIKEKEQEIEDKEENLKELRAKLNRLELTKNNSIELRNKISELDICPLCKQRVTKEHIKKIHEDEERKIKDAEEKISLYKKQEKAALDSIKLVKEQLQKLKENEKKIEINKVKFSNLKEKNERLSKLKKAKEEYQKRIEELNEKRIDIKEKLKNFKNIEEKHKKEKELLNEILDEQKEIEIKISELKKEKEMLQKLLKELEEEISKKEKIKKQIKKISQLHNWLEEYMLNLMVLMEKQVMGNIYNEFNDLVREWFDMLIEDEVINIRLDEEFTPIIEQNGYETYMSNLSGGEKTAVALSYRLALNKVINDLISGIKTKDLIILDEPTDGFSSEQLDRVKEVIDSLNIKQIIIVSHEPKIETFVGNVIKISKAEHESHIV